MKLQVPLVHVEPAAGFLKRLFPGREQELDRLVKRAQIGLEMTLRPMRSRHSKEQQGAYWASLHEFGRYLGYNAIETEQYLHPVICSAAYGVKGHRDIRVLGQSYSWPIPRETSSKDADGSVRDIETYSILIDSLIRFAAEHGYVIEIKERRT